MARPLPGLAQSSRVKINLACQRSKRPGGILDIMMQQPARANIGSNIALGKHNHHLAESSAPQLKMATHLISAWLAHHLRRSQEMRAQFHKATQGTSHGSGFVDCVLILDRHSRCSKVCSHTAQACAAMHGGHVCMAPDLGLRGCTITYLIKKRACMRN